MELLTAQDLSKTYHYDEYPALDDISFVLNKGETVSLILGMQGGKTTLAKILVGVEASYDGQIFFDGKPLADTPPKDRDIAYITLPLLYDKGKVSKNAAFGMIQRNIDKKTAATTVMQSLCDNDFLDKKDQKVKKLSQVDKCRFALIRAYLRKVRLAIFDNIIGIDPLIDKIVTDRIQLNQNSGITTLVLCDNPKQAYGKIYKFTKIDIDN